MKENKYPHFDELDRDVCRTVCDNGGITSAEIARQLRKPDNTIRYRVASLSDYGYLKQYRSRSSIKVFITGLGVEKFLDDEQTAQE